MRLDCPYCSNRDAGEFTQMGEDKGARPDPEDENAQTEFVDYLYLRDNPAGLNNELWYHAQGCRQWLRVVRNTKTHEIISVELAATGLPPQEKETGSKNDY